MISKKLFVTVLFITITFGCKEVEPVQIMPGWLQERVMVYESNCVYFGTKVTRYFWDSIYVYEIYIPISSCYMCDVYYSNGDSLQWSDSLTVDMYRSGRKNKKILWTYNDEDCLR